MNKSATTAFHTDDIWAINFADGTYVLGRRQEHVLYSTSILQNKFSSAGEQLHSAKSQLMMTEEPEQGHILSTTELDTYVVHKEEVRRCWTGHKL